MASCTRTVAAWTRSTTYIDWFVAVVGGHTLLRVILLKAFMVAAFLGTTAFLSRALRVIAPSARFAGVAMFLWNPLLLVEIAAEGHNDALMLLCVAASLTAAVEGRCRRL